MPNLTPLFPSRYSTLYVVDGPRRLGSLSLVNQPDLTRLFNTYQSAPMTFYFYWKLILEFIPFSSGLCCSSIFSWRWYLCTAAQLNQSTDRKTETRVAKFGPKVGRIGLNYKSYSGPVSQLVWNMIWRLPDLSNYGQFDSLLDKNMTPLIQTSNSVLPFCLQWCSIWAKIGQISTKFKTKE